MSVCSDLIFLLDVYRYVYIFLDYRYKIIFWAEALAIVSTFNRFAFAICDLAIGICLLHQVLHRLLTIFQDSHRLPAILWREQEAFELP